MSTQRIYCYVDETGQETIGRLFLVAVVVTGAADRDALQDFLRRAEDAAGKHRKWHRTRFATRDAYLRRVLPHGLLRQNLFYAVHPNTQDYVHATIQTTAVVLLTKGAPTFSAKVIVDGLRPTEVRRFRSGLRAQGLSAVNVRGMRDESDSILRLADALAGFLRDYEEQQPYARTLFTDLHLAAVIVRA
jgi:hypothetical protein